MSLDSTDSFSNVTKDTLKNEANSLVSEEINFPKCKKSSSWCYLFVHYTKIESVTDKLKKTFNVFVHKSIRYKKEKGHVHKEEQPTISGLIFVQGEVRSIQNFLENNYLNIRLVNDCSTGKVAIIPDKIMQPFMQLSRLDINRIRFMPHTFGYYASGHSRVRITSGPLAGIEGYQIRIAKDRCLVTSIGGITIAISKVNKESFENLDEYIRQRQQEQQVNCTLQEQGLNAVQTQINQCFFHIQNQLDILSIAGCLNKWTIKAHLFLEAQKLPEAAEIVLFILDKMQKYFHSAYENPQIGSLKEITEVYHELLNILYNIESNPKIPEDLSRHIKTEKQLLSNRYPALPIKI